MGRSVQLILGHFYHEVLAFGLFMKEDLFGLWLACHHFEIKSRGGRDTTKVTRAHRKTGQIRTITLIRLALVFEKKSNV